MWQRKPSRMEGLYFRTRLTAPWWDGEAKACRRGCDLAMSAPRTCAGPLAPSCLFYVHGGTGQSMTGSRTARISVQASCTYWLSDLGQVTRRFCASVPTSDYMRTTEPSQYSTHENIFYLLLIYNIMSPAYIFNVCAFQMHAMSFMCKLMLL